MWFGRLERDLDNLRAALSFCREHDEHELEFQLAVALWEFWWTHGYVSEGRRHLLHALQSAGVPDTSVGVNALVTMCRSRTRGTCGRSSLATTTSVSDSSRV